MNSVTVVIFLTSSLGLEIFISAANPVFPWGLASLYAPIWIFQEPGGFLQVIWRGENSSFSSFCSLHWFYCCSTAATAGLDRVCLAAGSGVWIGSIKTFNKIILKGEKKKSHPAVGSRLTFAPRPPLGVQVPQPLRWCTGRLQSESSFVLICTLVAQLLLQTKLQHPIQASGPPSFPPHSETLCGAHV